jgi:CheY-like chemotaxis protein
MKVWLIDDDSLTNLLNKMLIEKFDSNIEITCFEHAEEAILKLANYNSWPEVIYLDINMPVMNAWDFLDAAREIFLKYNDNPEIHILTSSSNPKDRDLAKGYSEVSAYLVKPLNEIALEETLGK